MRRSGPLSRVLRVAPLVVASLVCTLAAPQARAADAQASTETVEQLAERAYQLQAQGRYADAVAIYLKAYALSKDALTLLNIATIYDRKLHENELASEYYRRYVMAPDADPDRVKKVTERLTTLKKEEEEQRARSVAVPPPVTAQPPAATPALDTSHPATTTDAGEASDGSSMRTAGVVVGVIGIASLGASLALGAVAKSKNDDANAVCNGSVCASQDGVSSAKSAGSFATGSTIAFAAGLGLVGGGVLLYVLAPRKSPTSSASIFLAPRVDTTGAGLALHGAF